MPGGRVTVGKFLGFVLDLLNENGIDSAAALDSFFEATSSRHVDKTNFIGLLREEGIQFQVPRKPEPTPVQEQATDQS